MFASKELSKCLKSLCDCYVFLTEEFSRARLYYSLGTELAEKALLSFSLIYFAEVNTTVPGC